MSEEKKPEKKEEYNLVKVPENYTLAIETPTGELLSEQQAIVLLLNEVKDIKKALL